MVTVSKQEFERRWQAARQAMAERNLDFLVAQSSVAIFDGNVRWFADISVEDGYTATVIFPRDDAMTTITHGATGAVELSLADAAATGIKKRINVPMLPILANSMLNAEKLVEELAPYKNCRVGFVGMSLLSTSFYKYVTENLPSIKFEDATDMIDRLKAIKSDEEIELIRGTCAVQDAMWEHVLPYIKAGKSTEELRAQLVLKSIELGGDKTNVMIFSIPAGTGGLNMAPRVFGEGDQIMFLMETNGPGGFWGELGRIAVIGKATDSAKEHYAFAQKLQKVSLDVLKPGVKPLDMWNINNETLRNNGYFEEGRIYSHGQGYDMVERPAMDAIEKMEVAGNMNIVVHPGAVSKQGFGWVCENFLIKANGEKECLHKAPQKLYEV